MTDRLKDKVVIVTGAASGLGAAQARVFAREGAKVMLADISDRGADNAAAIQADGGKAEFVRLDVSDSESWKAAVAATLAAFGSLTSLSNTAGIIHYAGVEDETIEGWNRIIAINQTGVLLGMQAALPALVASGNGAIVNVSSLIALIAAPAAISYSASKSALRMMSRVTAMEYVKKGVRVNTIVPGAMQTPMQANVTAEADAWQRSKLPMGDLGEPEAIAYGATSLLYDEAKYVTGAELVVDGGLSVSA